METKEIITFLSGFIVAMLINYSTHIFAKIRDKKNNFLSLSNELRKPFIEAVSIFDLNIKGFPSDRIIDDVFIQLYSEQKRSIHTIIPLIPHWQRSRLQCAWNNYEKQINKTNPLSWFNPQNLYKESAEIIGYRKEFISQLDYILFFFDYHNMFSVFKIFKRLKC